jgi:hypothetical protein
VQRADRRMRFRIWLVAALTVAAPAVGQQPTTVPERLMIGPEEYLRAPRPFPIDLGATSTRLDSVRAGNLAPRNWGMANARPCRAVALVDTAGWQRIDGLSLPAEFARDSSFRSYHGGLKWKAGDLGLIMENGWWGVAYDSGGYLTSCRVQARSGEYIVSQARTPTGFEFRAFPWDPRWRPSGAIVGHAPTEERLRILWTAFLAMVPPRCGYMTGGPVRDPRAPPC